MSNKEADEALMNHRPVRIRNHSGTYAVTAVIKRASGVKPWFQIECKDVTANSVNIVKAEDIEYA